MACKITKAIINSECEYKLSGVREVYLINYDDFSAFEVGEDGQVSSITATDSYVVEFNDETANLTDELQINGAQRYRMHSITAVVPSGLEVDTQMKELSLGHFVFVAVTKQGVGYLCAYDNGAYATTANYTSGAAAGDAEGWTLTLAGATKGSVLRIEEETLKTFIGKAHRGQTNVGA